MLFRPDLLMSSDGDESSSPDQTSRPLWLTPHGMANPDASGHVGGSAGKFHKQVMEATNLKGKAKLNPQFVEWLMGWPIGWTGSALAATEWCLWQLRMRSALSQLVQVLKFHEESSPQTQEATA